jgi:hypothetical protein
MVRATVAFMIILSSGRQRRQHAAHRSYRRNRSYHFFVHEAKSSSLVIYHRKILIG